MSTGVGEILRRPACMGDIPALQYCDSAYSEMLEPWRAKDFKYCLRDDAIKVVIVEAGGVFAGYMIYEEYVSTVEILRISVDHMFLRCGVGSHLVDGLCKSLMLPKKPPYHRLRNIIVDVPELNLRAQQFFKCLGFKANLPFVREEDDVFYRFTYEQFGGRCC